MSLIVRETVLGLFGHGGKGRPGIAVTYATGTGDIRPASDVTVGLRCRVRYEIDMSDHRDQVEWKLPSRDERMFTVRIGVGWRVSDPCEVTRRRTADGFGVILGYLHPVVRKLSRVLEIEQLHDLEDQVNQLLVTGPARFPEGLEVFHVDAQVSSDEQTVSHAATLREKDRGFSIADWDHRAERSAALSQIDLDQLRRRAVEQMVAGDNGLLLHHLTVHREDTMGVAQLLMQQNQISADARTQLLEQFKDRLLPEELDGLAELLIRHTKDAIERPSTPAMPQPAVPAIVPGTAVPPVALPAASGEPLRSVPLSGGAVSNGAVSGGAVFAGTASGEAEPDEATSDGAVSGRVESNGAESPAGG